MGAKIGCYHFRAARFEGWGFFIFPKTILQVHVLIEDELSGKFLTHYGLNVPIGALLTCLFGDYFQNRRSRDIILTIMLFQLENGSNFFLAKRGGFYLKNCLLQAFLKINFFKKGFFFLKKFD